MQHTIGKNNKKMYRLFGHKNLLRDFFRNYVQFGNA